MQTKHLKQCFNVDFNNIILSNLTFLIYIFLVLVWFLMHVML